MRYLSLNWEYLPVNYDRLCRSLRRGNMQEVGKMINSRFVLAVFCALSVLTVDFAVAQSNSKKIFEIQKEIIGEF